MFSITDYFQFLVSGLTIGAIYSLLALGFYIVHEGTDIFNFAYGEIFVLGGLLALTLSSMSLNLVFILLIVIIVALVFGLLFERIIVRPVVDGPHLLVIISTIAAGIVIENFYFLAWDKEYLFFPPFLSTAPVNFLNVNIGTQNFFVFGLVSLIVLLTYLFFNHTYLGKAMKGAANNRQAARAVGIKPNKMVAYAFGLSFVIAMIAGVVVGPITYVGGSAGPMYTIKGFVAAILGGIRSQVAVILGGLVLGVLEMYVAGLITSSYRDAVALAILLTIFMFKPEGIFVFKND